MKERERAREENSNTREKKEVEKKKINGKKSNLLTRSLYLVENWIILLNNLNLNTKKAKNKKNPTLLLSRIYNTNYNKNIEDFNDDDDD